MPRIPGPNWAPSPGAYSSRRPTPPRVPVLVRLFLNNNSTKGCGVSAAFRAQVVATLIRMVAMVLTVLSR